MTSEGAAEDCLGVVGAGAMGQGIAQVAIQGGIRTLLLDSEEGAALAAASAIRGRLGRLVEKGRLAADAADAASRRLEPIDDIGAFKACNILIEAIVENLESKQALFRDIEKIVRPDCLIASNTSSIPIASIARVCEHRDRIAGMHFFNPVPLMKLVEIIRTAETSDATVEALRTLGERMTRTSVTVKDSPGFLVNMGGRAYTTEGLRIAHEGVAAPAAIDAVMRDCRHFPMGPFELMDLTGIDVNYPVSQIVYDGYQQDPRIKTSANHMAMFDAGLFGRKTGAGWYRYEDGMPIDVPSPDHVTDAEPAVHVALARDDPALAAFLDETSMVIGADDGTCPILAAPFGEDATHTALATQCDHRRLVCLDLSGDTKKRVTIMTAPGADPLVGDAVASALHVTGRRVTAIKDSPGFIAQRMAAMVANLGCYMAEIGLASPDDIDTAMKLGLNYPLGPLELAEDLGTTRCQAILERLQAITGEDRYRPTLWLKRRAALGLPIRCAS
ncbi:MAG: 3-hydroxyacyl-CoA dehydrogenase [Geminicoccaceae bacterium]